jgi:hypothetical protein
MKKSQARGCRFGTCCVQHPTIFVQPFKNDQSVELCGRHAAEFRQMAFDIAEVIIEHGVIHPLDRY